MDHITHNNNTRNLHPKFQSKAKRPGEGEGQAAGPRYLWQLVCFGVSRENLRLQLVCEGISAELGGP